MSQSTDHRLVIFRADVSPQVGGGHVMRCLSLAQTLEHDGWRVAFATRSKSVCDFARLVGLQPEIMILEEFDEVSALEVQFPSGCSLLVVDHYELDVEFEVVCRPWANQILVVSDQPGQRHECDFLLDSTPGRAPSEYEPYVPTFCSVLAGPRYAPIRPEFVIPWLRSPSQGVGRVLVMMGATDPDNITGRVLDELAQLELKIDVVLSSGAPFLNDVLLKKVGEIHVDANAAQLAHLMQAADLAIGAGGSSAWERCATSLPSLLFVVADNQVELARRLEICGAARILGRSREVLAGGVAKAIQALKTSELDDMAVAAHRLCDGRGAVRVSTMLGEHETQTGGNVTLRPVTPADCQVIYQWQINPDIRRYAHETASPSEIEHESWFARRLADPEGQYFVVELEGAPAGMLRLEPYSRTDGDWLISILIAPDCQRQGLGRASLDLAHALWPVSTFVAEVLPENTASHHLFASAGYTHDGNRYMRGGTVGCS